MPLINCKVELSQTWTEISGGENIDDEGNVANAVNAATFKIKMKNFMLQ